MVIYGGLFISKIKKNCQSDREWSQCIMNGHFDGSRPVLPVKGSIDTMLNVDGDFDRYGDRDITCEQTSKRRVIK